MPNRSAAHPVIGITVANASVYAVTDQATVEYAIGLPGVPKTVWNVGSATLTTVMSRIDMMAPSTTTPAIFRTARSMWSGSSGRSTVLSDDMPAPSTAGPPSLGARLIAQLGEPRQPGRQVGLQPCERVVQLW